MAHVSGPTMGLPGYRSKPKGPCDDCVGKIANKYAQQCADKYGVSSYTTDKINPYWSERPHYKALYDAEVALLPPADVRVQGETDSFGAEYHDLCFACQKAAEEAQREFDREHGSCDTCGAKGPTGPYRDPDEGSCGPVYYDCNACATKRSKRWAEELVDYDD